MTDRTHVREIALFLLVTVAAFFLGMVVGVGPSRRVVLMDPSTSRIDPASGEVNPPPSPVYINGESWTIESDARLEALELAGYTHCDTRIISYNPNILRSANEARGTILHESFHAGLCPRVTPHPWVTLCSKTGPKGSVDMQHQTICELGSFLPSFMHDNPEFMQWENLW
jgi:hypothetical protein